MHTHCSLEFNSAHTILKDIAISPVTATASIQVQWIPYKKVGVSGHLLQEPLIHKLLDSGFD